MNQFLFSFVLFFILCTASSQVGKRSFYRQAYKDNMSFIAMDTIHSSQTTIIEYPDFLVAIELPFEDEGGGKTNDLKQDSSSAQQFLVFLQQTYKSKPLKYIFSSHWHLHSLSAFDIFQQQGTRLITTSKNWQYASTHGFTKNSNVSYQKAIIPIKKDTTFFAKSKFPIQVLYIDSTYTNKPTQDYLFFHFPKITTLHASCMCALSETDLSKQTHLIYSDRLIDLQRAIDIRHLVLTELIKLGRSEKINSHFVLPVFKYAYLQAYLKSGKPMKEVADAYAKLPEVILLSKQDSLINDWMKQKASSSIINQAVYNCIKEKHFEKAVLLARLLNLYIPGISNYIDTLGEACFMAGKMEQAKFYHEALLQMNPLFKGGIKSWESNTKK
jgi:hypothetical protein